MCCNHQATIVIDFAQLRDRNTSVPASLATRWFNERCHYKYGRVLIKHTRARMWQGAQLRVRNTYGRQDLWGADVISHNSRCDCTPSPPPPPKFDSCVFRITFPRLLKTRRILVLWDAMTCSKAEIYQAFVKICCLLSSLLRCFLKMDDQVSSEFWYICTRHITSEVRGLEL